MRLTKIDQLREGHLLAADVAGDNPTIPLVRAGVTLTATSVARLGRLGISAVWVRDPLTDDLPAPEPLSPATRAAVTQAVKGLFEHAGEALARKQPIDGRRIRELAVVLDDVVADLGRMPDAAIALRNLASADSYTHHHSVNVCVVGLLVAREHLDRHGWVDREGRRRTDGIEDRLRMLGLGLLLHDVGKALVPPEVLNKPGRLTDAEWAIMRRHPDLGARMLSAAVVPAPAIAVVRDHHERCDGSGYGQGKTARELHEFARIAAVADTYDAIVAERVYQAPRPSSDAVWIVEQGAGTLFDAAIVESFSRVVAPYPLGTEIELEDGRTGVVVAVDMVDPWHPTVRVRQPGGAPEELTVEAAAVAGAATA